MHYQYSTHRQLNIPGDNFSEIISVTADIVTILGVLGLVLAYLEYRSRKKEEKKKVLREQLRAIKSVKFQLKVIGGWTNFDGGGYEDNEENIKDWIKREKNTRGNPFHLIFSIEDTSLRELGSSSAMENFSDEINEAWAWVNQWITSFNTQLDQVKRFAFTRDPIENIHLHLKLNGVEKTELTRDEELFVTKLVEMYALLHFKTIGNEKTERLHFWHKRLKDLLDKLEKDLKNQLKNLED